jgi:hypothetical protein
VYGEMRNVNKVLAENLKITGHFGDLNIDGRIILKLILNK